MTIRAISLSAGSICGGLVYRYYLAELTSKRLLQLSIVIGTATTGTDVLSRQAHKLAQGVAVPARSATILELT